MTKCPIIWEIEARRTSLGLTIAEMCEKAGVSSSTYQQWLYHGREPSYVKLVKILYALGLLLVTKELPNVSDDQHGEIP